MVSGKKTPEWTTWNTGLAIIELLLLIAATIHEAWYHLAVGVAIMSAAVVVLLVYTAVDAHRR